MPTAEDILNVLFDINGFIIVAEHCHFNHSSHTGIIWIQQEDLSYGICDSCGCICRQFKDKKVRTYRDVDFGPWRITLCIEKRRVCCLRCGVRSERLPFADTRSKNTRRFEIVVFKDCSDEPIRKVAHRHNLSWDSTAYIEKKYLKYWQSNYTEVTDVTWLGIDEMCLGRKDKVVSVISNLKTGSIIGLVDGNSMFALGSYFTRVGKAFCNNIEVVCIDMWKAFASSVERFCPNAKIIYDKFHIMRHLNNAIDEVRRVEFFRKGGFHRELVKGKRWLFLRRWFNLNAEQKGLLKETLSLNSRLEKAYLLKEMFSHLWEYKRRSWAIKFLERWQKALRWQRLKPLEKFLDMIKWHLHGILNYCENKIPMGLVENINGRIRTIFRRTRGYINQEHFALKIMFSTSEDKHLFLNTFHT